MQFDLANLQLSGMTILCSTLRGLGQGAKNMEQVANRTVEFLFDSLIDTSTDKPACSLVRAYRTMRYGDLDEHLQAFGAKLIHNVPLVDDTQCLTLLASKGEVPEWNSRLKSAGHQTIPLPSEEVISRIPMISQLVAQWNIDASMVVKPGSSLLLESAQNSYNVFYVADAKGSAYIPAQEGFVSPYNIRSVIGFGGLLPSGDMFAVLMFTKVLISRSTADMFRNAAMNVKLAFLPFSSGPVFDYT